MRKEVTNPTSDRGLISKMYKELKKLDIKEQKSNKKSGYRPKQRTLNIRISNGQRHLRKCAISLAIREKQIKTTLRYHKIPVRMGKINNTDDSLC